MGFHSSGLAKGVKAIKRCSVTYAERRHSWVSRSYLRLDMSIAARPMTEENKGDTSSSEIRMPPLFCLLFIFPFSNSDGCVILCGSIFTMLPDLGYHKNDQDNRDDDADFQRTKSHDSIIP